MNNLLTLTLEMPKAIILCAKHIEVLEAAGFKFKAFREETDFECEICSAEAKRNERR